jgi:hypothetical protein
MPRLLPDSSLQKAKKSRKKNLRSTEFPTNHDRAVPTREYQSDQPSFYRLVLPPKTKPALLYSKEGR